MSAACRIVERYLDAFWDSRWEELAELLAPDAVYLDPLLPAPVEGRDAVLETLAYCHEWGTYRGELERLFGDDRHAAAELRIQGVVTAPPAGMTAAVVGKSFDFVETDLFDIDALGRVSRQAVYADALGLVRQLGQSFL
jgi:hypothetical protein